MEVRFANMTNENHNVKNVVDLDYVNHHGVKKVNTQNTRGIVLAVLYIYFQIDPIQKITKQKKKLQPITFLNNFQNLLG